MMEKSKAKTTSLQFVEKVHSRGGKIWFVSDLDGTLLGDGSKLSPLSRMKLKKLLAAGAYFTVASARSLQAIGEVLGDIDFKLPVIQKNGASISDYASGKRLKANALEREAYIQILGAFARYDVSQIVVTGLIENDQEKIFYLPTEIDNRHSTPLAMDKDAEFTTIAPPLGGRTKAFLANAIAHKDPRFRLCKNMSAIASNTILGITVFHKPEVIAALLDYLNSKPSLKKAINCYRMYVGDDGYQRMTIQANTASKANALKTVANFGGLQLCDCIAFGDNSNDREMLEVAGHGIAMENGIDDLKLVADEVISANTTDSVMATVEAVFNLEREG